MADEINVKFGASIVDLVRGSTEASAKLDEFSSSTRAKFISIYEASATSTAQTTEVISQATATWTTKFQSMFESVTASSKAMTANIAEQSKASVEKLEGFSKAVNAVRSSMMLLAEVAVFGWIGDKVLELAKKTAEYGHEVELASQKTNMSTDAIQKLGFAASLTGGNMESFVMAARKLNREIVAAKEGSAQAVAIFDKLGISSEELNKMSEDTEYAFYRIADAFKEHNKGADAGAIAVQLFSRAGLNMLPILMEGSGELKRLGEQGRDVGAVLGKDDVKAAAAFEQQMIVSHKAVEGLEHRLGLGLMPILINFTTGMTNAAKEGGILSGVMSGLTIVFDSVAYTASYVAEGFENFGAHLGAWSAALVETLKGNFKVAKNILDQVKIDVDENSKRWSDYRANLAMPVKIPSIVKESGADDDGRSPWTTPPKTKDEGEGQSRVADWEADLDRIKQANKEFYNEDLEGDKNYWQQVLAFDNLSSNERVAINKKVFELEKQIANEKLSVIMSGLKDEYNLAKAGSLERIDIARKEAKEIASTYGMQSRQYAQSLKEIDRAMKEFSDNQDKEVKEKALERIEVVKTNSLLEIEIEQEKYKHKKEAGLIDAQEEEQALIALENKKYAIELKALENQVALYEKDTKEYERAMTKIEGLAKRHQLALIKIMKPDNSWNKMFDQLDTSFNRVVDGILTSNKKMGAELKKEWNSLVLSWVHVGVKLVTEWIKGEVLKVEATKTANAAKVASDQMASDQGLAITFMTNMKKITSMAAAAAAGAYQAIVGIPYVGPVLAPIAAAVAFAAVEGFGAMASADKGYDIPVGVNPVTQLHQEEMVLPADIAKPLRNAIKSGGNSGGGSGGHTTMNIRALDAKSFKQFLSGNKSALRGLKRNFGFVRG